MIAEKRLAIEQGSDDENGHLDRCIEEKKTGEVVLLTEQ
jgi:hypothetical protein